MGHVFEIGGRYWNRHGEYEVVELDGANMVIQYSNGRRLETSVERQARIWKNIQAEERIEAEVRQRDRAPKPAPRVRQRGLELRGLQDHDFQRGVGGTSWRARTGLGGHLAERLSDTTKRFFQSYAIYRRAEVHIAQPSYYDTKIKWQQAKFVFELNSDGATYGFYIEKNSGPMDGTWDWPRFLAVLALESALRQRIDSAVRELGLHWQVYLPDDGGLVAQVRASPTGFTWEQKESNASEEINWSGFSDRLRAIEAEKWCDLYLCTSIPKGAAIAMGLQLVDPVTEVYQALLPLYEGSTLRDPSIRRES